MFLMTTAEYSADNFLQVGKEVRKCIRSNIKMVANTGDFDLQYAKQLVATVLQVYITSAD